MRSLLNFSHSHLSMHQELMSGTGDQFFDFDALDELYEAMDERHESASWHEWVGMEKVGWHEETNGHESWADTISVFDMRVDDMRFQFHGGMDLEDAMDELYEAMAGDTFEDDHHEAASWHEWVGV